MKDLLEQRKREFYDKFHFDSGGNLEKWERSMPDGDWNSENATLHDILSNKVITEVSSLLTSSISELKK